MLFVILATGFSWIAGTGYGCISFLYWRAYFTGGAREALIGAVIFTAAAYIQTGIAKVQSEIAAELKKERKWNNEAQGKQARRIPDGPDPRVYGSVRHQ
jgi:hypothetical protein